MGIRLPLPVKFPPRSPHKPYGMMALGLPGPACQFVATNMSCHGQKSAEREQNKSELAQIWTTAHSTIRQPKCHHSLWYVDSRNASGLCQIFWFVPKTFGYLGWSLYLKNINSMLTYICLIKPS